MSLSAVVKKALQTINRQLEENREYQKYLLNCCVRIVNHKYVSSGKPERYGFLERQSAFFFMATQSPNKLKLILNLASRNLRIYSDSLDKGFTYVRGALILAGVSLISAGSYNLWQEYSHWKTKLEEDEDLVRREGVNWLGMLIRQHVYKNTYIQNNTEYLVINLCQKTSINHLTVKGLTRIYEIRDVRYQTPVLLKSVLKTNVYYEDYIFLKLKSLIQAQLQSTNVRNLLRDVLVVFGKSEFCREFFAENIANALKNQEIKALIKSTGFSTLHSNLDDPVMRQYIVTRMRAAISGSSQSSST